MTDSAASLAERMRAICLALPEVTERLSHGAPTWFVRGKSSFVTLKPGSQQSVLTAPFPGTAAFT